MPELRIDPICGRRVYIAEDRAGRPNDYVQLEHACAAEPAQVAPRRRTDCPFCAGNEAITPDATATVLGADGQWRVRVIPNKFPAVSLDAACGLAREGEGRAKPQAAFGVHEVIVESPDHVLDPTALGEDHFAAVLRTYRDRMRSWAGDSRLVHPLVFKNSGFDAGASLEHIHSQLVVLPYVPEAVQAELTGAGQFFAARRQCVFCDLLRRETAAGDRLILKERGFAAVSAFAARQPYETWIIPERHAARAEASTDAELADLAHVLLATLRRLQARAHLLGRSLAYNLILHTGPFNDEHADSYHWHWELTPRMTHLAGLEWGAGVAINPVSPERAARELRSLGG
jgi:UDPglucose--hexose-1-phosphate uridylyltransferase